MNIRHRFIVRGRDDFRVFAAIPVSAPLLKWAEWSVPVERETLDNFFAETLVGIELVLGYLADARMASIALDAGDGERWKVAAEISRLEGDLKDRRDYVRSRMGQTEWGDVVELLNLRLFDSLNKIIEQAGKDIDRARERVSTILDPLPVEERQSVLAEIRREWLDEKEAIVAPMDLAEKAWQAFMALLDPVKPMLNAAEERAMLAAVCPEGVPYPHYTVEFQSGEGNEWTHVSIVEGCAWIKGRAASESEQRVTEIVSQMLTERAANPKADTRVSVVESDPAAAHQARLALRRGSAMRTIRFNVTPPRYLRHAAAQILTSTRRAHWVIGHWRNQAHGPGRSLRDKRWIAPHIRGLGDASSTVAAIVAPRPEQRN